MPSLPKFKSSNSKASKRKLPNHHDDEENGKVIALNPVDSLNLPVPVKDKTISAADTLEALFQKPNQSPVSTHMVCVF